MGDEIEYVDYTDESMLRDIQKLVVKDLSEPYSIFTYRYFLHAWPSLCICAYLKDSVTGDRKNMIATVVCKIDEMANGISGYIGMVTVDDSQRKKGIGLKLARLGISRMSKLGCHEIMLETEASNLAALNLYLKLGFMKVEKLSRYYLNGGDAYRLKLWIDKEQLETEQDIINGGSSS